MLAAFVAGRVRARTLVIFLPFLYHYVAVGEMQARRCLLLYLGLPPSSRFLEEILLSLGFQCG